MKKMDKKQKVALGVVGAAVALFLGAWFSGGSVAINSTPSMPQGLYLVRGMDVPQRGDVAAVCIPNAEAAKLYRERDYLPASSRCAVGIAPVLKPVVAVPGDDVRLDERGVWVNGRLLENSRVFDTDSQGRPIQHLPLGWHKTMATNEYFMLANRIERSLDSRYYGTVNRPSLVGKAFPIVTL